MAEHAIGIDRALWKEFGEALFDATAESSDRPEPKCNYPGCTHGMVSVWENGAWVGKPCPKCNREAYLATYEPCTTPDAEAPGTPTPRDEDDLQLCAQCREVLDEDPEYEPGRPAVEQAANLFMVSMSERVAKLMRQLMRHRERYVKAWVAATGLHPTECQLVEQVSAIDGSVTVRVEKREADGG